MPDCSWSGSCWVLLPVSWPQGCRVMEGGTRRWGQLVTEESVLLNVPVTASECIIAILLTC